MMCKGCHSSGSHFQDRAPEAGTIFDVRLEKKLLFSPRNSRTESDDLQCPKGLMLWVSFQIILRQPHFCLRGRLSLFIQGSYPVLKK